MRRESGRHAVVGGIVIKRNPYEEVWRRAAVVEILDEYARDPMGGGEGLGKEVKGRLVEELAKRRWIRTLLAEVAGEAVGLLVAVEGFSTFAGRPLLNIHDVAVRGSWRGRGVGGALLGEAERWARELGACKLTLEVLEGNEGAQRLYRRLGFGPYQLSEATGRAEFWEKAL